MKIAIDKYFLMAVILNVLVFIWILVCESNLMFGIVFALWTDMMLYAYKRIEKRGSVKNFVALVKNGSFLVIITDMTILIEKEFIYGSSKRANPTDYYRK